MTRTLFLFTVLLSFNLFAQQNTGTIRGTVFEMNTNIEVIGAKVLVKGTSTGALTDLAGNFSIQIQPGTYDLVITSIAMDTLEITGVGVTQNQVTHLGDLHMKELGCILNTVTISCNRTIHSESAMYLTKCSSVQMDVYGVNAIQDVAKINQVVESDAILSKIGGDDDAVSYKYTYLSPYEYVYTNDIQFANYLEQDVNGVKTLYYMPPAFYWNLRHEEKEEKPIEWRITGRQDRKSELEKEDDEIVPVPDIATEYEKYNPYAENKWIQSREEDQSTFSIDVDNASYTNFRRFANQGKLPPKESVRLEEWLNYFNYDIEAPGELEEHPLKITSELAPCPWAPEDDLLMIKMKGEIPPEHKDLPPSNLVFLVDVSGSMSSRNKLPLLKESMMILTDKLRANDKITIVTYAGSWGIALNPTSGDNKEEIKRAIRSMSSGGGTAGSAGLISAYDLAEQNLLPEGNNRVIIATDGDWNIGITDNDELKTLIEEKRKSGIYLSVLGFGMGNYNDVMMEMLADNGNGNYSYVDDIKEAKRIFNMEFSGTMYTVAKDVKIQITFDEYAVKEYRLIGYENRVLENYEFDDDAVDAGDLGMGQNVVAFYQIKRWNRAVESIGKLEFRYKPLDSETSLLLSHDFAGKSNKGSSDFDFASCVIEYGLCLLESENRDFASMTKAIERGRANLGDETDSLSYAKRVEFVGLMEKLTSMYEQYVLEEAPELEIQDKPEVRLYPNPVEDFATIEIPKTFNEKWSIQIFNMNGVMQKVSHFQNQTKGRIDVTQLEPGNYVVKVYSGGFNFGYVKMVVQ